MPKYSPIPKQGVSPALQQYLRRLEQIINDLSTDVEGSITSIASTIASIYDHQVETFTLDAGDIANKYIELTYAPLNDVVLLSVVGGPEQLQDTDYERDLTYSKRVSWNGLGLDGVLATGDVIICIYWKEA